MFIRLRLSLLLALVFGCRELREPISSGQAGGRAVTTTADVAGSKADAAGSRADEAGARAHAAGGGGKPVAAADANGSKRDDCDAKLLPSEVSGDLTIGPGCFRIDNQTVVSDGTLSIAPGTTLLMGSHAYLSTGFAKPGGIVAKGTADMPIVFTSSASDPQPGDWGCVFLGGKAFTSSELDHVTFEYGGSACRATGASLLSALILEVGIRALTHSTFRHNANHGLYLRSGADVQVLQDDEFSDNARAPVLIAVGQLTTLGTGLQFDADDHIDVDIAVPGFRAGRVRRQAARFRIPATTSLGAGSGELTIEAGTVFELVSGSLTLATNFVVAGTAEDPVVFTSANANPKPGDWGCVVASGGATSSKFDHARFEFAGSGQGCPANFHVALVTSDSTTVTHSAFEDIAGSGIQVPSCKQPNPMCENNQFSDVQSALLCAKEQTDC